MFIKYCNESSVGNKRYVNVKDNFLVSKKIIIDRFYLLFFMLNLFIIIYLCYKLLIIERIIMKL